MASIVGEPREAVNSGHSAFRVPPIRGMGLFSGIPKTSLPPMSFRNRGDPAGPSVSK
jgi:hypothetical protein